MDIILALEKLLYSDKYDINYYRNILLVLQRYLHCDNCKWVFKNGNRSTDMISINDIDNEFKHSIFINANDSVEEIILYNPRIVDELLFEYIKVFLRNIRLVDERVRFLKTDRLVGVLNSHSLSDLVSSNGVYNNIGVCFIDCNGLKYINDTFGHEEGDRFLITVGSCIKKYVRENEVYRKGGDEFVIICENIPQELFYSKMECIRNEIINGGYSASFGYVYSNRCDKISSMIEEADKLMYVEKSKYYNANNVKRRK